MGTESNQQGQSNQTQSNQGQGGQAQQTTQNIDQSSGLHYDPRVNITVTKAGPEPEKTAVRKPEITRNDQTPPPQKK